MSTHSPLIDTAFGAPGPQITFEQLGGSLVVRLAGNIDIYTAHRIDESLRAIDPSGGDLVLDLAAVPLVDSAGLNAIRSTANRLGEHGRTLIVRCPEGHVSRSLRFTGIVEQIALIEDLDELGREFTRAEAIAPSNQGTYAHAVLEDEIVTFDESTSQHRVRAA
jgi:anti-sigma B factor antagonist